MICNGLFHLGGPSVQEHANMSQRGLPAETGASGSCLGDPHVLSDSGMTLVGEGGETANNYLQIWSF